MNWSPSHNWKKKAVIVIISIIISVSIAIFVRHQLQLIICIERRSHQLQLQLVSKCKTDAMSETAECVSYGFTASQRSSHKAHRRFCSCCVVRFCLFTAGCPRASCSITCSTTAGSRWKASMVTNTDGWLWPTNAENDLFHVNKVPFLLFSPNSIARPLNTVWSRLSQQCFIFVQPYLIVFAITISLRLQKSYYLLVAITY